MSELIEKNVDRAAIRCLLLAGVSALALTTNMACETALASQDSDRPAVWIEIGGEMQQLQGMSNPFLAPFMDVTPTPAPYAGDPFIGTQRMPHISLAIDGALSFQPKGSDWTFSAGVRYGRSKARRHIHNQTAVPPVEVVFYSYPYTFPIPYDKVADSRIEEQEQHVVLDFRAGKDVGLGLLGREGSSLVSAGVRFAQFTSKSSVDIQARPTIGVTYPTRFHVYAFGTFNQYMLQGRADRSFNGIGPSLSWNASTTLLGNRTDGAFTMELGIDAAILFGRQKARTSHLTQAHHHYNTDPAGTFGDLHGRYSLISSNSGDAVRSRSVVVPNIGGFAGFSVKYPNAKFSFGYRIDAFFGAMDTGIDATRRSDVTFHGPFAAFSVGLGG